MLKIRQYLPHANVGDDWHIANNPTGYDTTLCGIADDGEGVVPGKPSEEKDGNFSMVTCQHCREIVLYCKKIRTNR